MPLFEIETPSHIIITWANDEQSAVGVVRENYPKEDPVRITKRPRDTWVISKAALGITGSVDPPAVQDLLNKAGDDLLVFLGVHGPSSLIRVFALRGSGD